MLETTDLAYLLSTKEGSAGYTLSQSSPSGSLGKYASTTEMVSASMNALFRDYSGSENVNATDTYRCLVLANLNQVDSLIDAYLKFLSQTADGVDFEIGLDPAGVVALDAASQFTYIADEFDAPVGVSFVVPTQEAPLVLGTIGPEECIALWFHAKGTGVAKTDPYDDVQWRVWGSREE